MRLICLVLILQAFGGQLLMGSGILHEPTAVQSVVLVDSGLIQNLPKEELVGSLIVPIEGSRDVISQITTALNGLRDIRVLRVISHGSGGGLYFGSQKINAEHLASRSVEVAGWGQSLADGAEVLLYGCSLAGSEDGAFFARELARLTHANVAASVNPTGAGGDTFLEYKVGEVSSGLLANHADYERAGVSLQLEDDVPMVHWGDIETWHSEITSWTNNQNGTATVTMAFDLQGEFYVGHDNWSTNGYVYMYRNNIQVASKYINVPRNSSSFTRVTFTATFPRSIVVKNPAGHGSLSHRLRNPKLPEIESGGPLFSQSGGFTKSFRLLGRPIQMVIFL